jgi:AraC-like DNA-binding protein
MAQIDAGAHGDVEVAGLDITAVAVTAATRVFQVDCRKGRADANAYSYRTEVGLVLPRRGGFLRESLGRASFVDSATAYFERPGVEQRVWHGDATGDRCTAIAFPGDAFPDLVGREEVPDQPIAIGARLGIEHRAVVTAIARGADEFELEERIGLLASGILELSRPEPASYGRRVTAVRHRRIADRAREAITADPATVQLPRLARHLGVSRFHLSRLFRETTGITLSAYRNGIRVSLALDRISDGERNLALLAADLGFADQSHMAGVVRRLTGATPSALRSVLA